MRFLLDAIRWPQYFYGLLSLPTIVVFIPFYIALALLGLLSFTSNSVLEGGNWAFTLENYSVAIFDSYNAGILARTVVLSVLVGIACTLLAIPLALGVVRSSSRAVRLTVATISLLPFMVNALVRIFALTAILGREGVLNLALTTLGLQETPRSFLRTDLAVFIGQVYFLLPFAVMTITGLLARLPLSLERASQTLGANEWRTFWTVTLPLLRPGLIAAGVITYSLSASAFVVPLLLGGDQYKMYSNLIYDQIVFASNFGVASAMSIVLLGLSVALLTIASRVLALPVRTVRR